MKRGFTLIELLGVIIILALIALLTLPPLLSSMNSNEENINEANKKMVYSATDLFISDNLNSFPKYEGSTYCINISKLVSDKYLDNKVYENKTGEVIDNTKIVKIIVKNNVYEKSIVDNGGCITNIIEP